MSLKCWICAVVALMSLTSIWANPSHDATKSQLKENDHPSASREVEDEKLWSARMGDKSSSGIYRQLFIYTPEKLTQVEFRLGDADNWDKMKAFSTEEGFAYGTESFLPTAPGQKFTVRGINEKGERVTQLVTVQTPDGLTLSVKKLKVEDAKTFEIAAPIQTQTSRVLQLAQSNVGRTVGSGDCSALKGGQRIGTLGGGGAGMEKLAPGMVLRLSPGASLYGSMGRFNVSSLGHYVVVESVQPDGTMTFLDQNWLGGSSAGRKVRRATANLRSLNGSATIYSGD
ncbi:MAG: hypothetical protein EBR01_09885 [Proteobacteria bacterium]|nr:hypothetical protein [Pseudomonadota bacterium]